MFGLTLRNVGIDMKVVAIWVIPLCILNVLSNINISSVFNAGGIEGILLLAAVELLMIFAAFKFSTGTSSGKDKIANSKLMFLPVAAIGSLIIIPAVFMPGITAFTPTSLDYFIVAFIFVGPAEELVFRGFIQSRLNEAFDRPRQFLGVSFGSGLIIASLLFGLLHMLNTDVFNPFLGKYGLDIFWGVIAFFLGLILGFVREKTGSIVAPAILHGALDFFNVLFV